MPGVDKWDDEQLNLSHSVNGIEKVARLDEDKLSPSAKSTSSSEVERSGELERPGKVDLLGAPRQSRPLLGMQQRHLGKLERLASLSSPEKRGGEDGEEDSLLEENRGSESMVGPIDCQLSSTFVVVGQQNENHVPVCVINPFVFSARSIGPGEAAKTESLRSGRLLPWLHFGEKERMNVPVRILRPARGKMGTASKDSFKFNAPASEFVAWLQAQRLPHLSASIILPLLLVAVALQRWPGHGAGSWFV
ncbi:hypothetical protein CRG98_024873 [Punica granatum]|uniref:Uncharacterized protein n=1 Tax=Punica granatum TaxID=22663 RepID=A0A2I0JEU5_PUNGR|nr:hypothetical protein CRG98_024873 [Punica granatum]